MKTHFLHHTAIGILVLAFFCCSNPQADEQWYAKERNEMVKYQIEARGVKDKRVLDAMETVKRHLFVPEESRRLAYEDHPLPIGEGQTISQPYIVAYMTEMLKPKKDDIVLEIGTGSGYQAAILSHLVKEVYTIEIVEKLGKQAKKLLGDLKYENVHVRIGDGYKGWPKKAPFDKIILTAAPPEIPDPLIEQLAKNGRMVAPVGDYSQKLLLVTKDAKGEIHKTTKLPVRFVPMTGEAQKR